jgi:1,4-alpha-glucan branching enzyme
MDRFPMENSNPQRPAQPAPPGAAPGADASADQAALAPPSAGGGPPLTEFDVHLLGEGTHYQLYEKLGAHLTTRDGAAGTYFAVWAPNAERVSVKGDWNGWDADAAPMRRITGSGLWEVFLPGVGQGARYKYCVVSGDEAYRADKADPVGFHAEVAPGQASIVWPLDYEWGDTAWMASRGATASLKAPMSIYEVHLGSWMRVPEESNRSLTYREIAPRLAAHVKRLGFTHVELLPVMEHPFYGSWGYQVTGYFAPTSRYGTPQDLMFLVEHLHEQGIGVIFDWVPSHFPTDEHGLGYFDGTHLYEHADPRQGFHPDWNSFIFNYNRHEVRSFLIASARFWLDKYHADGIRVDGVASMLYLDYSRKQGEWIPNEFGGRENLAAISLLRTMNEELFRAFPDTQTIAEESTAWPLVSRPTYIGGLGFGLKWDMGWMHDTLAYMATDPVYRAYQHNQLTFRQMYAGSENFVLPLSHDEVVHGKGSLLGKMPGDTWQRFANLRLLFAYMWAQNAKKMLFMGGELGQLKEWNHDSSLDWHLADEPMSAGLMRVLGDLNALYRSEPAMHERDCLPGGFDWVDVSDAQSSVISFLRKSEPATAQILVVCNFTPIPRYNYRLGVPYGGEWREVLNTDATDYGGSGKGNMGRIDAAPVPLHRREWSVTLTLPPLAAVFLKGITPPPPPAEPSLAEAPTARRSDSLFPATPARPVRSAGSPPSKGPRQGGQGSGA